MIFKGLFSNYPATFTAQCHWYFYALRYNLFELFFWVFGVSETPPHPIFELNWEPYMLLASVNGWGGEIVYLIITTFASQRTVKGGGGGLIHVPLEGGGGAPYFGGQRQFLLGSQTVKISFL